MAGGGCEAGHIQRQPGGLGRAAKQAEAWRRCAGSCPKGDACRFAHVHTGALRQQWVADMRTERQRLSSWHGFAHGGGAAAKRRRAQVLAAWLVQTYGRELLNSGEGVLDVAGGAGGVTFELRHAHSIRCTLVDPRPLKLNKPQLRQLQAAGRGARLCTLTAAQLEQQEGAARPVQAGAMVRRRMGQALTQWIFSRCKS
ncbi:Zinc CCCH-type isoform A [Chlorella sorokiniana]|uniref:Zinc CCCH-type isoform A n=1 Tax=Chlorella sorokiniana TaxID=3076 RepID=A0A2P6TP39_CHLSO|nr:Zinc CCCH-type isoform A [Chlorella sorokiniana]|eukprot:PRW51098.1 Zinc CCCH-type isoform A [Chlorella sorokiniana]